MGWFTEEPGGLNRMYAGLFGGLADCGMPVRGLLAGDARITSATLPGISFFARRDESLIRRLWACRRNAAAILNDQNIAVVAAHFAPYALPVLDLIGNRRLEKRRNYARATFQDWE